MKYTVLWTPSTEETLAELWLSAADPDKIQQACDTLDAQLAAGPKAMGESREENARIAFETPIGIEYRVFPSEQVVIVGGVWMYGRA